jgi:hypothetical protein
MRELVLPKILDKIKQDIIPKIDQIKSELLKKNKKN